MRLISPGFYKAFGTAFVLKALPVYSISICANSHRSRQGNSINQRKSLSERPTIPLSLSFAESPPFSIGSTGSTNYDFFIFVIEIFIGLTGAFFAEMTGFLSEQLFKVHFLSSPPFQRKGN
jgi:hypothetical protein